MNRIVPSICLLLALAAATAQAQENWTQQFPANSPSARKGATMAYDPVHQQSVLYGGCEPNYSGVCSESAGQETWLWNGSNWTLASTSGPSPRFRHVMAWDPIRQRVLLFGGLDVSTLSPNSDTWLWDGTSWTQLSTSASPAYSNPSYMAFDPHANRMVLLIHGNYYYGQFIKPETWFLSSSASAWTEDFPAHVTFNLDGGGMIYDPVRQQIVLESTDMLVSGANRVSNTYVLAEPTPDWIVQSPLQAPPPTWNAAYAFDASSGRFLKFGGYIVNGLPGDYSDTWAWDGNDWTLLTPATSPHGRSYAATAYDEARQQVVLFGGEEDDSPVTVLGDTWTFQGATTTPVTITVPAGVQFTFNGQTYTGSQTIDIAAGSYALSTPSPQTIGAGTQAFFTSWSDGGTQTHTVSVGLSSVSIIGAFKSQYLLTTSANPTDGGSVTQFGTVSNGPYYDARSLVSVFESPAAGFSFAGWSGACSGTGACFVTMNAPATVTGSFVQPTYRVSVNVPAGVQYSIGGFPFTGSESIFLPAGSYFLSLASPQATAPGTQQTFFSWSDGGAQSHNLVVTSSALTVTGAFKTQYLLTTVAAPAGHGSVVGGGWYDAGTPVAVLASPAPGYVFEYFSGACSGSTCLAFMTGPLTVTANFSPPLTWVELFPATSPSPRSAGAMVWDTARQQGVLFGGYQTSGVLNDTWVFNGANWSAKSPITSPGPRNGHGMVYDSGNALTVLFGGDNGNSLADTWIWNGTNWIQKSPANSPSPRQAFGMAYDVARAKTVLFGGSLVNGHLLNDTWLWDGSNWTQVFPAHLPAVRSNPAMAYDAVRQVTVLFGGLGTNGVSDIDLNDTWIWNGTDWILQAPASSPSARSDAGMTYDASHQQMLLFGGALPSAAALGDTWTWDGTNWTQRPAAVSPSARLDPAMAFDGAHQQPVLFGGVGNAGSLSDTWEWVAPAVNLVVQGVFVITTAGSAFFQVGVELVNQGNVPVTNLSISGAKFGGVSAAAFVGPASIPMLAASATVSFTAQFPVSAIPAGGSAAFIAQGTYSAAGVAGAAWTDNIRTLHIQ